MGIQDTTHKTSGRSLPNAGGALLPLAALLFACLLPFSTAAADRFTLEDVRDITTDPGDTHPSWSSDGSRIAIEHLTELRVLDAETGEAETPYPGLIVATPSYQPGSEGRLVFAVADRQSGTSWDLWIGNDDGAELRQLTFMYGMELYPTWTPDGASVLFSHVQNGQFDLWRIPAEGGQASLIPIALPGGKRHVELSPDGTRMAFSKSGAGGGRPAVWIADVGGGAPVRISDPSVHCSMPSWNANGHWILYHCSSSTGPELRVWDARYGTTEVVAGLGDVGHLHGPVWSPRGDLVGFAVGEPASHLAIASMRVEPVQVSSWAGIKDRFVSARLHGAKR